MTPTGLFIVLLCFVGPILPPVIGIVVGAIYDVFTRSGDSLDVQTRLRLSQKHPGQAASRVGTPGAGSYPSEAST